MINKEIKFGVLISYLSIIFGAIISIIYTPIMINIIGINEFGVYNFVLSIIAYLGLLNFGFSSAYLRYYTIYKVGENELGIKKLNGIFVLFFIIISIITLFLAFFINNNLEIILGEKFLKTDLLLAKNLFTILTINLIVNFLTITFDVHLIANEKFIFQKTLNLIKTITSPLFSIVVLYFGFGSIGLASITLLINIFISIAIVYYNFRKINFSFTFNKLEKKLFKDISIFSSYIFLNIIVDQINLNVDKILIGRIMGPASISVYVIAAQLNTYYITFSTLFSSIFNPRINSFVINKKNDLISDLFIRVGRIQFIILAFIYVAFILIGREFIYFWVGEKFDETYIIALILMTSFTIPLIQNTGIEIQKAMNLHKFRSLLYIIIAVFNIILSIYLINIFGVIGAALGTAVSLIIGNGIIINYYYATKIKLDIKLFWKNIFSIMPSILGIAFICYFIKKMFVLDSFLNIAIFGLIYTIIYIFIIYFFGLKDYEKKYILSYFRNI